MLTATDDTQAYCGVDPETGEVYKPRSVSIADTAVNGYGAVQKPAELAAFLREVICVAPSVIVEIGSYAGGTLYAWNQVAETVIAVDLPPTGTYAATGQGKLAHGSAWVWGDSHDPLTVETLKGILAGRPIDVLFIDGDHTYEGVKRDYEMYSPLVRDGGLIGFHDIIDHPEHPDIQVSRFWREIRTEDADEFVSDGPQWGGIGVLHATGH